MSDAQARPRYNRIPVELQALDQWLLWKQVKVRNKKTGEVRLTKKPFSATGGLGSSTNPDTWASFQAVRKRLESSNGSYDGIGCVFSDQDGYAGIDLDKCLDANGRLKKWAQPILKMFGDTYAEISPSNRGIKIWTRAKLASGTKIEFLAGGEKCAVEAYSQGRYFTVTGRRIAESSGNIRPHQAEVEKTLEIARKLVGKAKFNGAAGAAGVNGHAANGSSSSQAGAGGGKIPSGQRHQALLKLGVKLRRQGLDPAAICAALLAWNQDHCDPPKDEKEVIGIAAWIGNHPPGDLLTQHPSDYGNAQRVIQEHGQDLKWSHEKKCWLLWDGRRWRVDYSEQARTLAHETMLDFGAQALKANLDGAIKFAQASLNTQRIHNMLRDAQPTLTVDMKQFDTHPDLINFNNGTYDLRTRTLGPHKRDHYITKLIPYDYKEKADCPVFLEFLGEVTAKHPELVDYLQRVFGYALTGHTSEKVVFLLTGPTDTGKTTLLTLMRDLLAEYATGIQIESLLAKDLDNNAQADLSDLRGARFAMTSETEAGQKLSVGRIKRITQGFGGVIRVARKFENLISFPETHKLFIDSNSLPEIPETDDSIWNRMHAIPFDNQCPKAKQDKHLGLKLRGEAEGILSGLVDGALAYYQARDEGKGLDPPAAVRKAVKQWRIESDPIGRFLKEQCTHDEEDEVEVGSFYREYAKWCEDNNDKPVSSTAFGRRMTQEPGVRRMPPKKVGRRTQRHYRGVALKP
jgi:putative DNA primase/helicase